MSDTAPSDLGTLASRFSRLYSQALSTRLAPHGVTPGQLPVLLLLWERDGQTQAELCRAVGIEQPTMANTLGRMVRAGLVDKQADPTDRRRSLLMLTPRALELRGLLTASMNEVSAVAERGLSAEELAMCRAALARGVDNLEGDVNQPLLLLEEVVDLQPVAEEDDGQEAGAGPLLLDDVVDAEEGDDAEDGDDLQVVIDDGHSVA